MKLSISMPPYFSCEFAHFPTATLIFFFSLISKNTHTHTHTAFACHATANNFFGLVGFTLVLVLTHKLFMSI